MCAPRFRMESRAIHRFPDPAPAAPASNCTVGILLALLFCTGCGSDTSRLAEASAPSAIDSPRVSNRATVGYSSGLLYGELYMDGVIDSAYPIQILVSEDWQFRTFQSGHLQTYPLLRGSFDIGGMQILGEGIAIRAPGETWSNGESLTAMSISGSLLPPTSTSDGRLVASVSMGSGDTGRIDATYNVNAGYYRRSDLWRLTGTWLASEDQSRFPTLSSPGLTRIDVSADGSFSGTDSENCSIAGDFGLIDIEYGLWTASYTISECARSGTYSGLALWGHNGWYTVPNLYLSTDDGSRAHVLELWLSVP